LRRMYHTPPYLPPSPFCPLFPRSPLPPLRHSNRFYFGPQATFFHFLCPRLSSCFSFWCFFVVLRGLVSPPSLTLVFFFFFPLLDNRVLLLFLTKTLLASSLQWRFFYLQFPPRFFLLVQLILPSVFWNSAPTLICLHLGASHKFEFFPWVLFSLMFSRIPII